MIYGNLSGYLKSPLVKVFSFSFLKFAKQNEKVKHIAKGKSEGTVWCKVEFQDDI